MKAVAKEERRVAYPLVLIFAILSLGIVVGGTFYYRSYERQFRTGIESQLSAIADLKAGELAQYRKERLGDAATFFQNAAFSGLVRRFFDNPEDADAQEQLRTWLDKYQTDYDRVFLLDTQGVERMSTPITAEPGSAVVSRLVAEVLQSRKIAFQDFHRNEHDQRIYLTLLVPILDGPDYSRALGVLALRVDTATYLYPFISRWPTPSRTAETLLVRRDGKDVLFLNELKFGTNTVLNLRISLENTNVAAVKAVLGQKGVVESMDYRRVPVLAALHAIPDSPWFLIARMDKAEVYAPLRERLWLTILLVGALLAGAGAGVGAIWRHQRVRFYKERSMVAEALRENEERLRSHTDNSPMAVVEWNADLIITRWTGAAEKMFGWSAEEAIGKPITELPGICEEDLPIVQSVIRQLADGVSKHVVSSNRNRTRNGQVIHCEWYSSVLHDAGGKTTSVLSQILDITARKRAEETIARERQLLRTLIDLLRETFYVKDLDSRFLVVNETLAKQYGKDTPSQLLGLSDADLYPAGLAAEFRAEEMKVFAGEPIIEHEDSMVFLDGRTHTVLTTKLPFRDSQGRICGLVGIGQDITARKRAEDELRRTNMFLDSIIENLPNMMFLKDARTLRFVRFNRAGVNLLGCSEADLLGKTDYDFFQKKELADFFTEKDRQVLRGKEVVDIPEEPLQTRDKGERILHTRKVPILNANGEPEYLLGISEDITERKRAEEALRESQALYHSLVEQLPVGVFRKDPAGRYVLVNPWFCRLKGMKAEEFLGKTPEEVAVSDVAKQDPTGLAVEYAAAGGGHHEQIMQTGKPIELVEKYTDADGRKQFVHAMKLPVFDLGGKVIGTQGLLFDITEIKQASEALHHEQTLMATLLETLPDPVYFKDAASRFLRVNPAMARRFGLSDPAQAVGKTDTDFFTGEHASKTLADEQEIIRTGQPLVNIEEKETWPDGSETWVLTTKLPLRDDAGRIIGTCGISSNITERKRVEQALAERTEEVFQRNLELAGTNTTLQQQIAERERIEQVLDRERLLLRTLIDNLPDYVYAKDTEGRFVVANVGVARQLGFSSPNEVIGKSDFDLFPHELATRYHAEEQEIVRSGQGLFNHEGPTVDASKKEKNRWVLTTKVPLRNAQGEIAGFIGLGHDITERKRAEEALRLNQERLLKVITQTRCILSFGQVEGPAGWRERALHPESPFHWDMPVFNEETAQKILPLELAADERYQQAWTRSRNRADHAQMNWNSGNAFLNDLPFYRNEFRCIDKYGVGHWMQQFVTVRKLAENRWEVFAITTDISDLKRVEVELRESQALYHSLVGQMPAGVFRKDPEGRYVFVNSAFCRLKDMASDQFLGKTVLELGLTDVALATKGASHHATIMQSGNPIEDDEAYSRPNGETRNYHVVKTPVLDSAGKIVGTQGILFDVTEHKRAEQGLEQAFQLQRGISRLHESLLEPRPLRDKLQLVTETIVRLFDADFCRIWLARPGDLCEQGCMHASVTEGPHVCRHREICLHLLASAGRYTHLDGAKHRRVPYGAYKIGRIAAGKETKFLIKNVQQDPLVHDREWAKELGLVSFAGYRLQSPGGAPLGVLALFAKRPLTAQEDVLLEGLSNATTSILLTHLAEDESRRELAERKRAEEALRWSETQLHVILESTADGILAVDSKGKVIEANQRFAELWRIPQSFIDARDDHALLDFVLKQLSDPDAFLKKVQLLYGTDALDMDTLAFKDGRVFERYSFPMMMDGAVIGRVWSFRDITGRKRQERELSEKNTELERFTYTVSHDLKSPLVTVKTFLGYLEQDLAGQDKERIKQDVAYMHTAADKMGQLLDELLNLARVGRKSNPAERVTFKELAQEVVRLVAGRISTGGAEVQVADAAVVLEGDRPRLMEIWQNLVENACKFMGNQPKPRVEIGVERRGSETVFFVRDNGAGIDPRYQVKVFGLFEKLDPKGEGTGMGLALVKRIVEMYKGRIWVESPGLGQGANFLFTLPGAVIIDPEQSS